MSAELEYIAKNDPGHILGVLEANRVQYVENEGWNNFFRELKVPILGSSTQKSLKNTFLPLPRLKSLGSKLGLQQGFGFLQELDGITDVDAAKWSFLTKFGVEMDKSASFWLALLERARLSDTTRPKVVFEILTSLQTFVDHEDIRKIQLAFREKVVLVPSDELQSSWHWTWLGSCVWGAPQWFKHLYCLQSLENYQPLQPLFTNVLGLSDVTLDQYLHYLNAIKEDGYYESDTEEEAKIGLIYDKLVELTNGGLRIAESEVIRPRFEEKRLVYLPSQKTWHPLSSCIWASDDIQLPDKVSLATQYSRQRIFFQNVLKISKPSLSMHIGALQQLALEDQDKENTLREMKNICALHPTASALRTGLFNCRMWPVRQPSGSVAWMTSSDRFAIADRKEYGQLFRDKVNVLDFSLKEIHLLNVLISGLGLEERYMSRAVVEDTRVLDGVLDDRLTKDLRKKAYAICRYAAHLGASDVTAGLLKLRSVEVLTSDDISKEVSITQGGKTVSVAVDTAYVHIAYDDGQLRVYVPHEQRRRQVCLSRHLPVELLHLLGVSDCRNGAALGSILTATCLFAVNEILDTDGIIEVDGIEPPQDIDESEQSISDTSEGISVRTPDANDDLGGPIIPKMSLERIAGLESSADLDGVASVAESLSGHEYFSHWLPSADYPPDSVSQSNLYARLLHIVVESARSMSDIPAAGDVLIAPRNDDWAIAVIQAISSSIPGNYRFRMGAAGELFMYEILKGLALPGLSLDCWRSRIQGLVILHEDYSDMHPRSGNDEPADIVYLDSDFKLTDMLIAKGYFNAATIRTAGSARAPKYYIEVKTTTEDLDHPFICSQRQVDRMESMILPVNGLGSEIYLIARVFRLGRTDMGFKLYMDPAKMRRDGELKFKTEGSYSVTPSTAIS